MDEATGTATTSGGNPDHDSVTRHRKALLGTVDLTLWAERIGRFMALQPGISGDIVIDDLSLPTAGGSSGTLLFAVTHDAPDGSRVTKRCVLRYATEGGLFHNYDLPGQYAILAALQDGGVTVPALLGLDADGAILGVTGYIMARIEGRTPPPSYYRNGVLHDASPDSRRRMIGDVFANLARLHEVDSEAPAFAFLTRRGAGTTPAEREINWYWDALEWGCPDECADLAPVRQWLIDNQPADMPVCVNHGDSTLSNYMFREDRVVAVLDWELAFLGNPALDVSFQMLAHDLLGTGCAPIEGLPHQAEWRAGYERIAGRPLVHWDYCTALSAYKLHVILLLVYREISGPEMAAARETVCGHTRRSVNDRIAASR